MERSRNRVAEHLTTAWGEIKELGHLSVKTQKRLILNLKVFTVAGARFSGALQTEFYAPK